MQGRVIAAPTPSTNTKLYLILFQVPVKAFTRFGPLVGRNIREEEMDFDEDRRKVFIIYTEEGKR